MTEPQRTSAVTAPFTSDVPVECVEAAGAADGSAVLALHGMGQPAPSFLRRLAALLPAGTAAVVPLGPYPYEIRAAGAKPRIGRAWYVWDGGSEAFLESMATSERWLLGVLDAETARRRLDPERIAILGFSQGGYLASFIGLRHAPRFRAVVCAGGRIKDEALAAEARAAALLGARFRVLHVHGEQDDAVLPGPSKASCERIAACGVDAAWRSFPCGHDILRDPACAAEVRSFLASALAP